MTILSLPRHSHPLSDPIQLTPEQHRNLREWLTDVLLSGRVVNIVPAYNGLHEGPVGLITIRISDERAIL